MNLKKLATYVAAVSLVFGVGIGTGACGATPEQTGASAEATTHETAASATEHEELSKGPEEGTEAFTALGCKTRAQACGNWTCGYANNGCGTVYSCGTCGSDGMCIGENGGYQCLCFTGYHYCPGQNGIGGTCTKAGCSLY